MAVRLRQDKVSKDLYEVRLARRVLLKWATIADKSANSEISAVERFISFHRKKRGLRALRRYAASLLLNRKMKKKASLFLLDNTTRAVFHRWCAVMYRGHHARRSAGERQEIVTRGLMKSCLSTLRSHCKKRQMLRRVFLICEERWAAVADELDNPYRVNFHLMLNMVTKWREFTIRCRRARRFVSMNYTAIKFAEVSLLSRCLRVSIHWK